MNRFNRFLITTAAAALTLAVAACGDATGPEGTTSVAFRAATSSASASMTSDDISFSHSGDTDAATITADGTNGQLTIASVHFVMSEFELERADEAEDCDDEEASEEACEEFEAEMQFLELPLTGDAAIAVQQTVPAGDYDELEFSIEELEDDEAAPGPMGSEPRALSVDAGHAAVRSGAGRRLGPAQTRSMMVAVPMPAPTQRVTRAVFLSRRSSSSSSS